MCINVDGVGRMVGGLGIDSGPWVPRHLRNQQWSTRTNHEHMCIFEKKWRMCFPSPNFARGLNPYSLEPPAGRRCTKSIRMSPFEVGSTLGVGVRVLPMCLVLIFASKMAHSCPQGLYFSHGLFGFSKFGKFQTCNGHANPNGSP